MKGWETERESRFTYMEKCRQRDGRSKGKMPEQGEVVCYEPGNDMASKDVHFAASIRHLVAVFSFILSTGVLVPFQCAVAGG